MRWHILAVSFLHVLQGEVYSGMRWSQWGSPRLWSHCNLWQNPSCKMNFSGFNKAYFIPNNKYAYKDVKAYHAHQPSLLMKSMPSGSTTQKWVFIFCKAGLCFMELNVRLNGAHLLCLVIIGRLLGLWGLGIGVVSWSCRGVVWLLVRGRLGPSSIPSLFQSIQTLTSPSQFSPILVYMPTQFHAVGRNL